MPLFEDVPKATDVGRGTLRRCGRCGADNDVAANPEACRRCEMPWRDR